MKKIQAKDLKRGMVVISSGNLKMRVKGVRIVSMTAVDLTVRVINSRKPKARHMHGREITFTINADNTYDLVKKS